LGDHAKDREKHGDAENKDKLHFGHGAIPFYRRNRGEGAHVARA
jgi:hypothetical protein